MSDCAAAGEPVHSDAESVEPASPHQRLDGPFAGLTENDHEHLGPRSRAPSTTTCVASASTHPQQTSCIELLKRDDSGVLKLAAPPQTIESVLSEFLPRYAKNFPNVRVKLTEALGMAQVPAVWKVHIGIRHDQGANPSFESFALPPDDVLAACRSIAPAWPRRHDRYRCPDSPSACCCSIPVTQSAGCSMQPAVLADVEPDYSGRSRAPHTLLALAEAGQGVAIIPSVLRTARYRLTIARVSHRGKPLRDRYVIQWDKRRPMPSYAENFCAALGAYMREVLPITRPSPGPASR